MWAVTILLAAGTAFIFLFTPQQWRVFQVLESHRDDILTNPEKRDRLTDAAFFREIDRQLPPDAKIFFAGVVGAHSNLSTYFFARTLLFPHEMEISLDHKADYQADGFTGVDCSSPEQLRTNGYDLMMRLEKDGRIFVLPLTQKGTLKHE